MTIAPAHAWLRGVLRPLLVAAALAAPLSAPAQSPDPVAPFLGTWSGVFTTQSDRY